MVDRGIWILAPHPDDEVIGVSGLISYSVTHDSENVGVIHNTMGMRESVDTRLKEAIRLADNYRLGCEIAKSRGDLLAILRDCNRDGHLVFTPDPIEPHPYHKLCTAMVDSVVSPQSIFYYTTTMDVPYIWDASNIRKKWMLDTFYPSQRTLWEKEWKYFLFEGYRKKVITSRTVAILLSALGDELA